MKILYIATRISGSGGVSKVLSLKANYFADVLQYNIHILSTNDSVPQTFYTFSPNVKIQYVQLKPKVFKFFQFFFALRKTIKTLNPELIIVADNGLKSLLIPFFVPVQAKCYYELHSDVNYYLNAEAYKLNLKPLRYFFKKQLSKFDRIITLHANSLFDFLPSEKQAVIPNPIIFPANIQASNNLIKAIAVGRIIPLKGYDRLLRIWRRVVDIHPEFILEIYGDPVEGYSLDGAIEIMGLKKNVKVFNAVPKIYEKYGEASFLLQPSHSEGFSMVMLEAMTFGLPIVCFPLTTVLANPDYCLISAGEEEFYMNILHLIENHELKEKMGRNAQEEARKYQIENVAQLWVNLFMEDNLIGR